MAEDITLGELSRRFVEAIGYLREDVGKLEAALQTRPSTADVEAKLQAAATVQALRDQAQDERHNSLSGRVDKVSSWGTWGTRLLLAAVGAALLAGILPTP